MNLNYSDEQQMLRDQIQKFCESDYSFEKREAIIKSDFGYDKDLWKMFSELGWLSVPFKEETGGLGYGPVELTILFEEFGKVLVVEPYLSTVVISGSILDNSNFSNKSKLIGSITSGEKHISLAYIESNQTFDHSSPSTTAISDGNTLVVNGMKSLVLNGGNADHIIASVMLDGEFALVLIDQGLSGYSSNSYPTVDGQTCAEIQLENVSVPSESIIAKGEDAINLLSEAINLATLCISAESIGCMTACYLKTVEYTKERRQFDQPISNFQVLQHRMVDMFIETEMCKSLLYKAMLECDSNEPTKFKSVSGLKSQIGTAGKFVSQQAVQLHGGMGVSEELLIGHYLKKLVAIDSLFGNSSHHLNKYISS
jgi:alkylation response protein AidB-like acyl-CoA dehydrogenase